MIEEQSGGAIEQIGCGCTLVRQRTRGIHGLANGGWRFAPRNRRCREQFQKLGNTVHEPMSGAAEFIRRDGHGRDTAYDGISLWHERPPAKASKGAPGPRILNCPRIARAQMNRGRNAFSLSAKFVVSGCVTTVQLRAFEGQDNERSEEHTS